MGRTLNLFAPLFLGCHAAEIILEIVRALCVFFYPTQRFSLNLNLSWVYGISRRSLLNAKSSH